MGWQPIGTAPKDGRAFLAIDDCEIQHIVKYRANGFLVSSWDHEIFENPTHWMPLPPPPKTNT